MIKNTRFTKNNTR